MTEHSSQTILDFLTLLEVEQVQENSNLFDATTWQNLAELDRALDGLNKSIEIADAILDWCEQHPKINQALNQTNWSKVRGDMIDENEVVPLTPSITEAESVNNKYRIQKIIKDNPTDKP